jgi:hypothetical protein
MNVIERTLKNVLIFGLVVLGASSCQDQIILEGEGIISGEIFETSKATFDVFATNKNVIAVQTNKLPLYQLGNFNHSVFGKTSASVATQLRLQNSQGNPVFGVRAQNDERSATTQENERATAVYLYIPFQIKSNSDLDLDGLIDAYDSDPTNPNSDSDGDGLTDIIENNSGTNPLNPDTDGDGINDAADLETAFNLFAKPFDLDSIYGDRDKSFTLTVKKLDYFLRDLDPSTNFIETQEYFSDQIFDPAFTSNVLFKGSVNISDKEFLFYNTDNAETPDINESLTLASRLNPGIRIPLNIDFFQRFLLDQEGSDNLISQSNFTTYLRGLHFSVAEQDNILLLLDFTRANITMEYSYDVYSADGVKTEAQRQYILSLLTGGSGFPIIGNAVNTITNPSYSPAVLKALNNSENASRIYLKGGVGLYSELTLFSGPNELALIEQIKANRWVVNEARLVFYVDTASLSGVSLPEPPRLYLYNAETLEPLMRFNTEVYQDDTPLGVFKNYDGILQTVNGKGTKYMVRITDHINNILLRDAPNAKLALGVTSDIRVNLTSTAKLPNGESGKLPIMATTTPLGTVLFGNNVAAENADKKLQLEIFYTKSN